MIVIMKQNSTQKNIDNIVNTLHELGLDGSGRNTTVIDTGITIR